MDDFDFEGLSRLVQNGFPLQQALRLLENEKNSTVVQDILNRLDDGQSISCFFAQYCPTKAQVYLNGFLKILPFSDALLLCRKLMKQKEEEQKKLMSALLYPLLMFLLSTLGIFVFKYTVYPSLSSMMKGFHVQSDSGFFMVLINVYLILVFLGAVLLLTAVLFLKEPHRLRFYQLLTKKHPDNVFSRLLSLRFVHLLLPCLDMGLGTLEWIKVLSSLENGLLFRFIMDNLKEKLETGSSLPDAILSCPLDPLLRRTIQIASYSSDMEKMLREYAELGQMRMQLSLKRITYGLQLISYALIGFILILIYQILMLPMLVLTQF